MPKTCSCGAPLKETEVLERFVEDIPLPELTANQQTRLVTKYLVPRTICQSCRKTVVGVDENKETFKLTDQTVSLGPNVRPAVCHLVTMGLSYAQIIQLLKVWHGLIISSGEIAVILSQQKINWTVAYLDLAKKIRASPYLHIDETSWKIKTQAGGYAWVMPSGTSDEVLFKLASTRGARIAQELLKDYKGVRISDGYVAYKGSQLTGSHQLCWAHLWRKIRDLHKNRNLPDRYQSYVATCYEQLSEIYDRLRAGLKQPFDLQQRQVLSRQLWMAVQRLGASEPPTKYQPVALLYLKNELLATGHSRLFSCLIHNTACDNNRVERDLRSLVLKRKRFFGCQTTKGAAVLEVILSLCTTTWRRHPDSYFQSLASF